MTPSEARAFFASIREAHPQASLVNTSSDDIAVLRVEGQPGSGRWAELVTPGERWFSLQLDGGFSRDVVDEEATDEEAREILMDLFELGLAYIGGNYERAVSRHLKVPAIDVESTKGIVRINLSIDRILRRVLLRKAH